MPGGGALRFVTTWCAVLLLVGAEMRGLTLEDFRAERELTPKKLMARFSNFKYKLHAEVQRPEIFLSTESGDCDDFATLAALLLREKGYTPRLVAVRMPGLTHVVCYVAENGSYLDYNNRVYYNALVKCKPELPEIANRVASSFDARWTTVSEFAFTNQVKIMLATVARTEAYVARPPSPPPPPMTNASMSGTIDISF